MQSDPSITKTLASPQAKDMTRGRLLELDIAKGVLVVLMLIYHTASMASEFNSELLPITRATSFLHYIFVFITGYLCGWLYMPRLAMGKTGVRKRIAIRSAKIMLVFLFANLLTYSLGLLSWVQFSAEFSSIPNILHNIFLKMNGGIIGFEVLFYISIFLAVAAIMLQRTWSIWSLLLIAAFASLSPYSTIMLYLYFGFLGVILGYCAKAGYLTQVWQYLSKYWWLCILVLPLYLLIRTPALTYLMALTPYYKLVFYPVDFAIWISALVFILAKLPLPALQNSVIQLGTYTLLAYLLQMIVLRAGYIVLRRLDISAPTYYAVNLIAGTLIVICLIKLAHWLREKNQFMDRLYTLVFI